VYRSSGLLLVLLQRQRLWHSDADRVEEESIASIQLTKLAQAMERRS
jgi:hypothetical protein